MSGEIVPEIKFADLSFCRKNIKDAWARKIFCGVYYIKALHNGKTYIGSSVWIRKRLLRHKRQLLNGEHDNPILQRSFSKHGIDNFIVGIVEEAIDEKDAKNKEQALIDKAIKEGIPIFNVMLGVVFPNHEHLAKTIQLVSPVGETVTITNIQKFCRDNNLSNASIYKTLKTNYRTKGWERVGREGQSPWKFINPSGQLFEIKYDDINDFCKQNFLKRRAMKEVWDKKRETHAGWIRFDSLDYVKLKSSSGDVFNIMPGGRAKFCRENSISETSVEFLIKRKISSCKGWTLVE